ncbi:hypothetical protein GCM10017708_04850 [Arthrobacter citreus]
MQGALQSSRSESQRTCFQAGLQCVRYRGGTGPDLLGYGYDQRTNLGGSRPGVLDTAALVP